jgi:hypothetical protein
MQEESGERWMASINEMGLELSRRRVTAPRSSSRRVEQRMGKWLRVDASEGRRSVVGMWDAEGMVVGQGKAQIMEMGHGLVLDSIGAQGMRIGGDEGW